VRDMRSNRASAYEPIGFVDDDAAKIGQRIHGVRVLGSRQDLARILAHAHPHEVLIAMPGADAPTVQGIVRALEPYKIPITTLPNLQDILNGKVSVNHIRTLAIEDLLPRAPVGLEPEPVRCLIAGKCVLVTGAGGSIGAELCRKIVSFQPRTLLLFERYENSLYALENELAGLPHNAEVHGIIGDVTDARRVHAVMAAFRPELVFHAAAHKHVPLMESHPCEAVKNNIVGTRCVAEAAARPM
jgi:FlaA1/EpsC-like NDP-sugar epimerase